MDCDESNLTGKHIGGYVDLVSEPGMQWEGKDYGDDESDREGKRRRGGGRGKVERWWRR
jgi:hypothetical protein